MSPLEEVEAAIAFARPFAAAKDRFLLPAFAGGYVALPFDAYPDLKFAPLGRCKSCRFTAPLTERGRCGPCVEKRHLEIKARE